MFSYVQVALGNEGVLRGTLKPLQGGDYEEHWEVCREEVGGAAWSTAPTRYTQEKWRRTGDLRESQTQVLSNHALPSMS